MYCIKKLMNPAMFQGRYKKKSYFEGWYYKIVDSKGECTFAIIPGIAIGEGDSHAFIQVFSEDQFNYFCYDMDEFMYSSNQFEFMIGDNYFSKSRIRLNLNGEEISLRGDLYFCNVMEYPATLFRPGVMGPFLFLPGMECYHDIINIQNNIVGQLRISGRKTDFTGGIGYIEKDWGKSMPKSWIWIQSNHFQPDEVSLSLCTGNIPFLGGEFHGFIAMFRYRDRVFMFTTYSGARISRIDIGKKRLVITFKDCRFRLDVNVIYGEGTSIKAPVKGMMSRDIIESCNAVVKVRFSDRSGTIYYEGIGTNTGFELVQPVKTFNETALGRETVIP